jgi:two-component system, NarL family, nitrate/nitrite response regulator NarL
MTRQVRVMLVDDHAFVRAAIRQAVTAPDVAVVAEASTAEEAMATALATRPDVLLLDIDLPGASGLDLLADLAPRLPDTRVVMLTVSTAQRDATAAMRLGAAGYLTKDLDADALLRSVRAAANGELAMPRRMAAAAMRELAEAARRNPTERRNGAIGSLTEREEGILRRLAEGLTDREIGEALSISTRTVETHVANILRKLDARNRAEAARHYVDQ